MSKAKIGTIAWHKDQIKKKSKVYSDARKGRPEVKNDVGTDYEHTYRRRSKKPKPRYRSRIEFDFLKYIRVIFKWAMDNSGLSRPNLELVLYLYGMGAFSKKQFHDYHKTIGMYQDKKLKDLIEDGWVKMWRAKKGREHALYVLTHKGKGLCSSMHKYAAGVEDIPNTPATNKMMREDAPRINNYYMDIIKRMTKDKAPE